MEALNARNAWITLAAGIACYDYFCSSGETLSEGCDRALESHKILTLGAIAITAGHLANIIPPKLDPFRGFKELPWR
jgi:hypothetical protein